MCGGQDHSGLPLLQRVHEIRPTGGPAAAIAPTKLRSIEPSAIGQAANPHAVRSTASLTNAPSALEPDPSADLRPIARIELAHLTSDRHHTPVAATPVPAVVATCASNAKPSRRSWRHQRSFSSLENREVGGHRIIGSAPSVRAKLRIADQDFNTAEQRDTAINPSCDDGRTRAAKTAPFFLERSNRFLRALAQHEFLDLAGRRLRQRPEHYGPRRLEMRELLATSNNLLARSIA